MSRKRKASSDRQRDGARKARRVLEEDDDEDDVERVASHGKSAEPRGPSSHIDTQVKPDCGVIESLTLKNFMCHSLLGPFKFGPNLNFITGNNGSGKSAVLTALIVGLGGKALLTSRGSSMKTFIKHGQSSADISITLRNVGDDPYKHDQYGDSIVIDNHISCDGQRYKLKSKSGRIVSTKKEELNTILDHFNIQVDNPVSILNQEMSKQFLHSKDEHDKYKFFMKATHLEQMQNDYQQIMETKKITEEKLCRQEGSLRDLSKVVKEKQKKFQRIANMQDLERYIMELQNQLAWAEVRDKEVTLKTLQDQLRAEENRTVKFDQNVEEHQKKLQEAELKYKSFEDQLNQLKNDLELFMEQNVEGKRNLDAKKSAVKTQKALVDSFQNQLRVIGKDCEKLAKHIDELKNSTEQQLTEAERAERARSVLSLKEELTDLKAQDDTLIQQIEHFKQAINKQKEDSYKLRREHQDIKRSFDAAEKRLQQLAASRTENLSRFNTKFPELLQKIENAYQAGKFHHKPIGPIGALIKARDPELALALESCLKGLLLAFCCGHSSDVVILEKLMQGLFRGWRPQIICVKFQDQLHDVRARAVRHPIYPSVLESLEIEKPVVANILIDNRGIESILLIKENATARQVMQSEVPPKNCREAFTKNGDQVFADRYYSCAFFHPKYLHEDIEEEVRQLQTEKLHRQVQLQNASESIKLNQEENRKNESQLTNKVQQQMIIQGNINKLNVQIVQIENMEEPPPLDISALEEEMREYSERKESVEASLKEALVRNQEAISELQTANSAYKDIRDKMDAMRDKAEPIKQNLTPASNDVEEHSHNLRHYEAKRMEHLRKIAEKKTELDKVENTITEVVEMAQRICPQRVKVTKTTKAIVLELKTKQDLVNQELDVIEDAEAVTQEYHDAVKKYENSKKQLKTIRYFVNILDKMMDERQHNYSQFMRYISCRCKYNFDMMLAKLMYRGKMTFDHEKKTLQITVQTSRDDGDKAADDMRLLSGGERSFSTVCFLLSLWNAMESPFRCLDEFDVFMDMVNRRVSMDMMLKVAKTQQYRQFIFLTPQKMSSLPVNRLVKILKLDDPLRGQKTLPFKAVHQASDEIEHSDES